MKFALVFPGQGSQSVGMMAPYGDCAIIRATFDEASAALGDDLWALALDGPAELQNLTVNTQPLMLTAGVAVFRLWRERGGPLPAVVAGHSLGEYSALVAAGVLTLAQAAPLVRLRAQAMQDAVPAGEGAMAAVMGLDAPAVVAACAAAAQGQVGEAVNFNEPRQTVIAGHREAVERAAESAKAAGAKRALMLPVSAPFHCSLMTPAAAALGAALAGLTLMPAQIPVINNVDVAAPTVPGEIAEALVRQAASPVRWVETMQAMRQRGVAQVIECGPGKVLTGLAKRCVDDIGATALTDAAAIDAAIAALT